MYNANNITYFEMWNTSRYTRKRRVDFHELHDSIWNEGKKYEERKEMKLREWGGDCLGSPWKKRKKIDGTWRASVSPPSPLSITHRFEALARFGNSESIIIDSKRWQIRNRGEGERGEEGRAGLPGANRRNAVSIIQLKTDMYRHQVGIVAKPAIVDCSALERRSFRQEDWGERDCWLDATPFAHPLSLASLRCQFDSTKRSFRIKRKIGEVIVNVFEIWSLSLRHF